MFHRWIRRIVSAFVLLASGFFCATSRGEDDTNLADYFGFLPVEIYKLDTRIQSLIVKDVDGDKADDVIVANNGRSRIDLLLTTQGPNEFDRQIKVNEPNQLRDDRRMRLQTIPVSIEISSMQAGDFNSDGKIDLAFHGNPGELVVLLNQGKAKFGEPRKISIGEALPNGNSLTVGDFNHDGKDDLALLSAEEVTFLFQLPGGGLGDPERVSHTAPNPVLIKGVDLDGDARQDLLIWAIGDDSPFRVRFAVEGGKLGPELRLKTEMPRAIAFGDYDRKKGKDFFVIENQSGRARVLRLADAAGASDEEVGRLMFYAYPQGSSRGRSIAVGDIDGDKRADVVLTDPANSQSVVFLQGAKAGEGLSMGKAFPGLVGGKTVKIADFDGDGRGEVVVLSDQEKQIGKSVYKDDRLSFPSALPITGEPVMMEAADLDGDKKPELLYITREKAKEGPDTYLLRAMKLNDKGEFQTYKWGDVETVALKGVTGNPAGLTVLDANQDGLADLLVFNAYGPPLLLTGVAGKAPVIMANLGPLAKVTSSSISITDLDGPAIIAAQNNFARKLTLDKSGAWGVADQYNSGQTSARIQAATAIDMNGDGVKEIALLDERSKSLLFLSKKDGAYRPSGRLTIGAIDFQGLFVADFDGDGRDDLLLSGGNKFGVILTGKKALELKRIAEYETSREDSRFADLIVGDLNADGRNEVVIMDTGRQFIEIAAVQDGELKKAMSFHVFEEKLFRSFENSVEPRDLSLGDVDGDGKTDIVLIAHNRVLVYRQDPGSTEQARAGR